MLSIFVVLGWSVAAQNDSTTTPEVTPKHVSYAYGYMFAEDIAVHESNPYYLLKGLKDGMQKLDTAKLARITNMVIAYIDADTLVTNSKAADDIAYNLGYNAMGNLMNLLQLSKKDFHYGWLKKRF